MVPRVDRIRHITYHDPVNPQITLVVPAFNEQALLPRLLGSVETARELYSHGRETVEIVVADNASTDDTARIAADHGATVVHVERRSIAAARNGGAAVARGRILTFADADLVIHPETFNAVQQAVDSGRVVAGASGGRLERRSLGIAVTWLLMIPWVVMLRMDTGVVFCLREDFERISGYDEGLLYAEDVRFLFDMRRLGRPTGRRLCRLKGVKADVSMRKFDRWGDWHYFKLATRLFPLARRDPAGTADLVRRYWYPDDR